MIRELVVLVVGVCTFYAPGVMDRVADYRGLELQPGDAGMVATLDCTQLGERVYLAHDGDVEGPFLVADCAEAKHRANLERRSLVAEVDWQTAQRWEMFGPVSCAIVEPIARGIQEGWR